MAPFSNTEKTPKSLKLIILTLTYAQDNAYKYIPTQSQTITAKSELSMHILSNKSI
jgi:hypothetical protein